LFRLFKKCAKAIEKNCNYNVPVHLALCQLSVELHKSLAELRWNAALKLDGWWGWVNGWVVGWMDGWMDGWVSGWMDGWDLS